MKTKRDPLIDILKGVGIISVVVGHSGVLFPGAEILNTSRFVYLYHLMLFFFTAGAVYSPTRYSDPYSYIGKQLKGMVPLYWGYNFAFLALHNIFSAGRMLDIPLLTTTDYVIMLSGIFTMSHMEQLCGALWFIPVLLLAKLLFSVFFHIADKCRYRMLMHFLVVILFAGLGLYTNYYGMYLTYHAQTAFLGVPIIYLGYLFSRYRENVLKYTNIFTCLASGALMYLFIRLDIGYVELSINEIISPQLFYPVTVLGLFFCISLAEVIQHSGLLEKIFCYFGSISFHIMTLHFLAFKCVDWLYGLMFGVDLSLLAGFPTALNNMGLMYSTVGIAFPVITVCCFRKCADTIKKYGTEKVGTA